MSSNVMQISSFCYLPLLAMCQTTSRGSRKSPSFAERERRGIYGVLVTVEKKKEADRLSQTFFCVGSLFRLFFLFYFVVSHWIHHVVVVP